MYICIDIDLCTSTNKLEADQNYHVSKMCLRKGNEQIIVPIPVKSTNRETQREAMS